jgi:protein SCO1/2
MPHERSLPGRIVIASFAALLVIALGGAYVIHRANQSRLALPVLGEVPEFTFVERSGEPFGHANLIGKISVVDFIFTSCPGICPIMADRMSRLYELYEGYSEVQFVSITVDPENDSLPVLREYAVANGVTDSRWVFLRGPIDEVAWLSEKGLKLPTDNLPVGHSSRFVLVDSTAQIRGYYSSEEDASQLLLQHHLRPLVRAMR